MEYVKQLLQTELNKELIALETSSSITSGGGFRINNAAMKAFAESRRLAEERIPQLEKALKTIAEIKKQMEKQNWIKPAIKHIGKACACCGSVTEILPLETKLYLGYGGWNITKNGKPFFANDNDLQWEENKDLAHVETLIGEDTENEYVAIFDTALRDEKYQRHTKDNWVLIETGDGFA